uniref:Ion transport domain-containing protein n=1 Tax=Alexandrium catenella TaxID=2925 RepID=A0A7S1WTG7_ALECA
MGAETNVRLFTVLRALRVVRLIRLVRTLPAFRELWLLVGGLANSMKALGWVALIALALLYVGGIIVTTEIGQNHRVYGVGPSYDGEIWPYEKYFGDVPTSMFSLFQVMTMDGWCDDIVRHVIHRQPAMGLFFVAFLFVVAFGLVNVVIGIIVENTLAAAQVSDRRAEVELGRTRRHAVEALTDLLVRSDSSRTGEISMQELQVAYESAIVKDLFKKIGLTMQEAKNLFSLLDYERRGRVELKRFANSCRELVGGAKRRDIAQVEITVGTLARHLEQLDGQFSKIEAEVGSITAMADAFVDKTVRTLTGFNGDPRQHLQSSGAPGRPSGAAAQ